MHWGRILINVFFFFIQVLGSAQMKLAQGKSFVMTQTRGIYFTNLFTSIVSLVLVLPSQNYKNTGPNSLHFYSLLM